ncbi:Immunoglobulin G-binding protein A [Durusdinium trenchii]|uniref:Immunoglobulin G-binding protein A n=1 Tax=Durusdinium trenchii TaxID=1381693 RepID=A0ABP0Q4Y0_9DINO
MGVGGIAIYPTNTYERSFGIFAAFVALMTFSTLVSKMTSLMSSLNKLKDEETEQFRLLRRYLIYNDIPLHLSQRIIRFLQHGYRIRNEALSAGNHLPILDLLSQSLQGCEGLLLMWISIGY